MTRSKLQIVQAIEAAANVLDAADEDELAGIEDIAVAKDAEPSLARFLDIVVFLETLELAKLTPDSPLWQQGLALTKLTQPEFLVDAASYLEPLFSLRGFGKYKLKWKALARPATTKGRFQQRGTFLRKFIGELAAKPQVFRDTFPETRLLQVARQLANVSAATTAPEALAILGSLRSVGGMSRLRAWNREAVKASGVEVDPFDDTVASVGEVRDLGKQIADTETQLQDPSNSTEAQDLQAKRSDLRAKLDEAVQQSPNPDVALAVAALAAQPAAYRTKVGELLKMNPVQEAAMMRRGKVIIAAGAGSGKCVRGDTYVTTAKGVRRIVDCSGTHAVVSVDADKLVVAPAEGTWLDMGTSQTYKITTSSGLEVVVTPEHPLLVWNGQATWKQAQHMEAGDVVLLLPGHALEVGVRKVSQDEAYLLGLWMGNGWLSKSPYRVCWSSSNSQIVDHYKDLAEKFWGVRPETYVGADKTPGHDISRASVVSYLEKLGIAPIEGETTTSARTKEIPEWLMGASAGERVSFLRGLFDTDGTASGSTFEWLSASEMLARQVHQMLLGLGVVGRLKPKAVDGYDHTYWRILVGGDQIRALQTLVGFRHDKQKQAVLDAICDKDCNPNVGVYPHVGNLLKQVRTEWKAQGRWDGHGSALNEQGLWPSVKDYLSEKRSPSKERLQKLVSTCTGEAANLLRNLTAFYPDEVVSIVKNGTERVYDYNVPTTHSFIANGIVSHNTRVLAGKVVYHINEEGAPADSVLATSFTRKSAGELKDRIVAAGGGIIEKGSADDGFGTTHSIAGKLLRRFRPDIPRRKSIGGKDGHSQNMLYKLAIAQVKMRPQSVASQPDPNESFFSPSAIAETMKTTLAPEPGMLPAGGAGGQGAADAVSFADSVDQGIAWLSQPGSVQMLKDSIPWVRDWVASGKSAPSWMALFQRLKSGVMPRENMERKDRDRFMEVMRAARIGFVPGVSASVFPTPSVAAAPVYFSVVKAAGKAKEYSQYDKIPANQWFNQGEKIAELQRQAAMSQDKNNQASEQLANFTPGNVGRAITRWKGGLIPSGKAYAESEGSLEAAAYAAYEWIKNNDPIYIGSGDADDLLINFSKLAVSDASFREALQRRFKVVLIDECFTGDTPILLDTSGQTRTIQDLVENKYSGMVASYDEATGQTVQRQVVGWHRLACKGGTVRVIVQRKGYGKDGMPLADLTSRVRYGRHIVECTPDHRFYVEGQWVAAKDLKPGTKVILESDAPRDDSYNARHKIGPQGRAALGQLMTEKNEAGTCGTNVHGGTITQRGGNGRGPTAHEQALVERLGAGWVTSHVVATGHKSPYPHHYKIDVAHPKRMLAIEVDGGSHQSPERQAQDRKKEALLTEHGWRVLRIKNKELAQMSDELIHERLSPCPVEAVVVAVEPGASTDPFVYDITVDQTHCYYAHGVLVHNCQDQNPAQHLMFGLITGYYDPATQQPRTDGVMTATTYAMIGDDKQAIYEFRGAEPTIFIDNSDSMGGPFKTDYLDTNYRSGKQIVDTAMNVISYNSHQIPMSCKPFPPRGQGAVHIVAAGVGQDAYMAAAAMVAEQVKTGVADGDNYKDYGVGCRTNKEAFSFAAALLSGGIPFRSKYNPLTHWSTQALINWVVLADADENNKMLIDDLVVKCLAAPSFEVSQKTLKDRLQQMAAEPQNKGKTYLQILAAGGWKTVYLDRNERPTSRNQEKVKPFLDALLLGKSFTGSPTDVIVRILNEIKGADGVSMADSLALKEADRESDDTDEEEVGDAANESEEAKNARLKEAALSPLQPIIETARNYGDLSSFIGYLRELARVNDKVFHNDGLPEVQEKVLNAVNIDTVHGWKGLEVKNMYVPMAAGTFPFFKGNIESERRLAYVAITRGEDSVTIFDIKRKFKEQLMTSPFIQEMICGKSPASVEVPVTSARAFANATRALEAVAQLMAAELAEPAPAAPAEPEEFPPAPEDILMTEAGDEGSEDDQADESGGQAALARSQALMARLKR